MKVNAQDLVVLHKNVGRVVGKEIFPHGLFANNDIEIMNSLEKLIKENILIKTDQFNISIHKKKLTELRGFLKDNGFKTTGTKQILINRISENVDSYESLDLPYVYIATEKGVEILKDTKYLLSFVNDEIGVVRAYYLAENYIDKNCEDKVAEIYKLEFQREYDNAGSILNFTCWCAIDGLIIHYEREMRDYYNSRKYLNIFYYLSFKKFLEDLINNKYSYYDDRGNLELEKIQKYLSGMGISFYSNIYERLIFSENLSNETIFELFKKDTQKYNHLEDELIKKLTDYLVDIVKKENPINSLLELIAILKNGYTIDKEKFEDEDDYYSNFITTNIGTLKELDSQIEVEVDIRNGKINFFLEDDSLEALIKKNE